MSETNYSNEFDPQAQTTKDGDPQPTGTDSKGYAHPDCRFCHGRGYVQTGPNIMNHRICQCVLLEQNRLAAQKFIDTHYPKRSREMTFATYNPGDSNKNKTALKVSRNFVNHWNDTVKSEGVILGFYGDPSSGKTHLATAIALALIKRYGISAHVLNVPNMLRLERERFGQQAGEKRTPSQIQKAIDADFLVLDDLGAERHKKDDGMSWASEVLYTILDSRIMDMKPIVYTTNLNPAMLKNVVGGAGEEIIGARIMERLARAEIEQSPLQVVAVPGSNRQSKETTMRLFS
jgi:DNA replication protein DnaC